LEHQASHALEKDADNAAPAFIEKNLPFVVECDASERKFSLR